MRIRIAWDLGEAFVQLDDTPTARAVFAALPLTATASVLGNEVHLGAPLRVRPKDNVRHMEPGTVCYWAEGASIVLPLGPAPVSEARETRMASPCNVFGRLEEDPKVLCSIRRGHLLMLVPAQDRTTFPMLASQNRYEQPLRAGGGR